MPILNNRTGETKKACCGLNMTIINYINNKNIDIQFEDGVIVTKREYAAFNRGEIKHPYLGIKRPKIIANMINKRIGETSISNYDNQKMTIINYRSCTDIDIQFETGLILYNKTYELFKNGGIKHPFPFQLNNIIIEKLAYKHNNIGNFYCTCTKCCHKDIWNINEIKEHKC
ncbi:MAG: hypothetical protein IJZ46_05730 [Bacilli bacterium]|nr:hypothetical protein [Bacilli bacterium]